MKLRLLTYNIHKGIGGIDRRYDLGRIVETILHYQPDVALLQEVDDGVPRSRRERQSELLAEATALPHLAFQRNVRLREGHYGNAILSRWPLDEVVDVELTVPLKKRRRAIVARCRTPHDGVGSMILVNVHLGLAGFERKLQLAKLLRHEAVMRHHAATPIVVGGDFNDVWGTLGRVAMAPAGFRLASGRSRSFPAARPLRPLDHVFVRGAVEPIAALAGHTAVARRASDHLPIVVELKLTADR
jgi:endonuclease/exonuclease/phosphatase family metal-dependent hydrolase